MAITPDMARAELARRELARRAAAKSQNNEAPPQSALSKVGNAALDFTLGAGDAQRRALTSLYNVGKPFGTPSIKYSPTAEGTAHTVGDISGGLAGFGLAGKGLRALEALPEAEMGATAIKNLAPQGKKILNFLKKPVTKSVAENAALGALFDPNNQAEGAGIGALTGALGHGLEKVLGTENPILKGTAGGLAGAGLGYSVGGKTGAELGGALGVGLALYPGASNRSQSGLLKNIDENEIKPTMKAARDLGVVLRPTEVTGRPELAAIEGKLAISPDTEKELYQSQVARQQNEKNAISNFLQDIAPSNENKASDVREVAKTVQGERESVIKKEDQEKINQLLSAIHPEEVDASESVRDTAKNIIGKQILARESAASPLYQEAMKQIVPESALKTVFEDKYLRKIYNKIRDDELYDDELKGSPVNSIKMFDLIKKSIDGEIKTEKNPEVKRLLVQKKQKITDMTDAASSQYAQARAVFSEKSDPIQELINSPIGKLSKLKDEQLKNVASTVFDRKQTNLDTFNQIRDEINQENPELWRRMLRNAIEDRISKVKSGDPSAIFYKNILGSKRDFDQFYNAAQGMPEIQAQLKELKTAFPESSEKLKELRKPVIAKIAKMNDSQLKNLSRTIFDPNQTDSKMFESLRDEIISRNPDAWRGLIRNEMERRIGNFEGSPGTTFYKSILENKSSFDQFISATKEMPDVQNKLLKMKDVFGKIINPITPTAARDEARIAGMKATLPGALKKTAQFVDNLVSGQYDKGLVNLLTDKEWDKQFNKIIEIKNQNMKIEKLGELLGKISSSILIEQNSA